MLLTDQSGEGAFAQILDFVSCIRALTPFLMQSQQSRQLLRKLCWTCTIEMSCTCVDTKPRGIKATCILQWWQGTILCKLECVHKNLVVASKQDYSNIPCMIKELNQSSLKSMPRRQRGHLHEENTYVRTWVLNRGNAIPQELTVVMRSNQNLL